MTNITTRKDYPSAGAASTRWLYDARGFMTNKLYADGVGPSYSHTFAGRFLSTVGWIADHVCLRVQSRQSTNQRDQWGHRTAYGYDSLKVAPGHARNLFAFGGVQPSVEPTPMAIRQNVAGDSYELLVSGRVDGAAANDLEVQVLNAIKAGAKEVFINLSEADFICSAGIRVIMQYWRQLKSQGKRLAVTQPSQPVNDILAMTGFRDAVVENPGIRA
jgi:anti-sigma B factor antagonist